MCVSYYVTEFVLFADRTAIFYKMEPQRQKCIRGCAMFGTTVCILSVTADLIWTHFGVILWKGADTGLFCLKEHGDGNLVFFFVYPLYCVAALYVGGLAVLAFRDFHKENSNSLSSHNFLILKYVFCSFCSSSSAAADLSHLLFSFDLCVSFLMFSFCCAQVNARFLRNDHRVRPVQHRQCSGC